MSTKTAFLYDDQGNEIHLITSYLDLLDTPKIGVNKKSNDYPALGPNVSAAPYGFKSRILTVNDFKIYFYAGAFTIKKDLFKWHGGIWPDPASVLFYLPDEIKNNTIGYEHATARLDGNEASFHLGFRSTGDQIFYTGNNGNINEDDLPDEMVIEIQGSVVSQ